MTDKTLPQPGPQTDNPQAQPEPLADEALDAISGGPNRRPHDHIGNFNLKDPIRPGTNVVTVADGSPTV